jgi:nitroimidazol reductase NimA-like FMN-containing flavoprotein (pyridoxamine 5'-phosphate oxidase superfamily)
MKYAGAGGAVCVTVTHVDGIVLARSIFNHSINYRSAVLFGKGQLVTDPEEKLVALAMFTERLLPGRWGDAREPNRKELKATAVVAISIESASAKVRTGPPHDDDEDLDLPVWAGVLPVQPQYGTPIADPEATVERAFPAYLDEYLAKQRE